MFRTTFRRIAAAVVLIAVAAAALIGAGVLGGNDHQARRIGLILGCKHGAKDADAGEAETEAADVERGHGKSAAASYFAGPGDRGCESGVESFGDLARANSSLMARDTAPGTAIKPGAFRAAVHAAANLDTVGGSWQPYGKPPLIADAKDYGGGEGFADISGRATAFTRDPSGTIYAAVSNGGIWKSTDGAKSWQS